MSRFLQAGLSREDVEKAVRSNAYTHEAACYEMLFSMRLCYGGGDDYAPLPRLWSGGVRVVVRMDAG